MQKKATLLGVTGWARNLEDGRVEVYGIGEPEQLNELEGALYVGPNFSEVRHVERSEVAEAESASGFSIR